MSTLLWFQYTQWWLHLSDTDDCQNCFSRKEDVCRDRRAVSPYPLSGDAFHGHFWKPSVLLKCISRDLLDILFNIWLNNLKHTRCIFIVFFYVCWRSIDKELRILTNSENVLGESINILFWSSKSVIHYRTSPIFPFHYTFNVL